MKQKKRGFNLYSYYDFSGMARHLEDMARQGWQLENIGSQFWTYRRCPPTEMRYAVVYFEKASDLDTAPLQEQQDCWEMCRTAGNWPPAGASCRSSAIPIPMPSPLRQTRWCRWKMSTPP